MMKPTRPLIAKGGFHPKSFEKRPCVIGSAQRELEAMVNHSMTRQRDILKKATGICAEMPCGNSLAATALRQQPCGNSLAATALRQQPCGNSLAATALRQQPCGNSLAATALRQQPSRGFEVTRHILSTSAFEVRPVCAALEVSPSGFYAHQQKERRPRRREDGVLSDELQSAFEQSYGTYGSAFRLSGSPRLVKALRERGVFTSKTRVRRLMKSSGLCPRQKRRLKVRTTRSNPLQPIFAGCAALTA